MSTFDNEPITPLDRVENLLERVEKLEAELASLIATDTYCWPDEGDDNPHVVMDAPPAVLVAVSAAGTIIDVPMNVYIYMESTAGAVTVGVDTPRWVVPIPVELGAVPYVPIEFPDDGIVAAVVLAADDSLVDPADYPGLKVTYAWSA